MRSLQGREPGSILVRGTNWLGDAVMTTPALARLRQRFPDTRLVLLTREKLAGLWQGHPSLDAVLVARAGEGVLGLAARLRREDFSASLVFPNSPRAALECWLGRIPIRVGASRPWRDWLLTHAVSARAGHVAMRKRSEAEVKRLASASGGSQIGASAEHSPGPRAHQLYDYLHLAAAFGCEEEPLAPNLEVAPAEVAEAARKFGLATTPAASSNLFALNPGAEYGPAKRWPLERFIAVAQAVQARTACQWLILGGPGDVEPAARLEAALAQQTPKPVNLAGKTSLRELMAMLKLSRLLLTNDTGPMHVAAALGTPIIAPFGSTSPALTGPGLPGAPSHRLLRSPAPCSPCFLRDCPIDFRCMHGISAESVAAAVIEVVAQTPRSAG